MVKIHLEIALVAGFFKYLQIIELAIDIEKVQSGENGMGGRVSIALVQIGSFPS